MCFGSLHSTAGLHTPTSHLHTARSLHQLENPHYISWKLQVHPQIAHVQSIADDGAECSLAVQSVHDFQLFEHADLAGFHMPRA